MTDILVNDQQWNSLTDEERRRIEDGLRETGAMQSRDRIVGDPSAPAFTKDTQIEPMWNPIKDICKATCDVTAAAGAAWCIANTAGVALAVCLAAAEAARQECRKRC